MMQSLLALSDSGGANVGGISNPPHSKVQINLTGSANYSLSCHPTPGIFDQAVPSVSFCASGGGESASGSARITNGPYDHDYANFGFFSGQPKGGGKAHFTLSFLVTPSGTVATEYTFTISVSASALDSPDKTPAQAKIRASFSSALTNASGQPIDMKGLGITILPVPTPDKSPDFVWLPVSSTSGPQAFALPGSPTAEELFSARVLSEPLVPYGSEPTAANNQTLAVVLNAFDQTSVADDFSALAAISL